MIAQKPSWAGQAVWIDPALYGLTVPLAQRKASDGLWSIGRGSVVPVTFDKVLRLFVYWKEDGARTDLDLSCIQYDADWNYVGHVSYTNLAASGIVHSGDLQSAPLGAAEFIDITLDQLDPKVAFLVVQVHHYCGLQFGDLICHAGWMLREQASADYKTFDIKTVVNKFDLVGRASYAMPLAVDLRQQRMLWTDLYMGGADMHSRVERSYGGVAEACREVGRFLETRPVLFALAELHVEARGGHLVNDRAAADLTIGLADASIDLGDIGTVLSDFL